MIPGSAQSGRSGESIHLEVGDVRLHLERGGAGPPVLLLHGGFLSHRSWDAVADRLRPSHDVIALDSRGQGASSDGAGPITYGRMAHDVLQVLDALGLDRVHVVGHSDGGCLALHLLVDHPERLRSAALIGTPLHRNDYRPGAHELLAAFLDAVAAGADEFLAPDVFERTAKLFPRGRIVRLADATHALPLTHSEATAEAITAFVRDMEAEARAT